MMDTIFTIGIFVIFAGGVISYQLIRRRDEYAELRKRKLAQNLNPVFLLPAYFRKKDDPLKPAYVKLATIGLLHAVGVPLGIVWYAILLVVISNYLGL
ncbi:hypothetical protein [Pseudovibrio ascidiaceicola]|nr:hypothetical protein [Pseudovibrio ascidiaceicola]